MQWNHQQKVKSTNIEKIEDKSEINPISESNSVNDQIAFISEEEEEVGNSVNPIEKLKPETLIKKPIQKLSFENKILSKSDLLKIKPSKYTVSNILLPNLKVQKKNQNDELAKLKKRMIIFVSLAFISLVLTGTLLTFAFVNSSGYLGVGFYLGFILVPASIILLVIALFSVSKFLSAKFKQEEKDNNLIQN